MTENSNPAPATTQSANNSTLIEFPGLNRNRPAWRKELSERFREIQQRRAREGTVESDASPRREPEEEAPEQFDAPASAAPPGKPAEKSAESSKQPRLV